MKPGYLHLDVSCGCTAELLNAALCGLLSSKEQVTHSLQSFGLCELELNIVEDAVANVAGNRIEMSIGGERLFRKQAHLTSRLSEGQRRKGRLWDNCPETLDGEQGPSANRPATQIVLLSANKQTDIEQFVEKCVMGEPSGLSELKDVFAHLDMPLLSKVLVERILTELFCEGGPKVFAEYRLDGPDALWIFAHTALFVGLIHALNPKFVTATKVPCSLPQGFSKGQNCRANLDDNAWLLHVAKSIPTIEGEIHKPMTDVLGVAFVKALASRYGARGESTIMRVGVGVPTEIIGKERHISTALWCEALMPISCVEKGLRTNPRVSFLYSIMGLIAQHIHVSPLLSQLSSLGAKNLMTEQVLEFGNTFRTRVSLTVSDEHKDTVVEAFLVMGGASEIMCSHIEQHALQKRMVSVPLGQGKKEQFSRFIEWLYGEKIVRTEVVEEDLLAYMQTMTCAEDVARGDLLMAWKKWRGRKIEPQSSF